MPAVDNCEPQVIRSLEKLNWFVINKPEPIEIRRRRRYIYADLRLANPVTQEERIVVEVKCFARRGPILYEFYTALGQYLIYRKALELRRRTEKLYLAIPDHAYRRLMCFPAVIELLREQAVHMIVIDLDREEVLRWID